MKFDDGGFRRNTPSLDAQQICSIHGKNDTKAKTFSVLGNKKAILPPVRFERTHLSIAQFNKLKCAALNHSAMVACEITVDSAIKKTSELLVFNYVLPNTPRFSCRWFLYEWLEKQGSMTRPTVAVIRRQARADDYDDTAYLSYQ